MNAAEVKSAWALNERQDRASGCISPWTWLYPLQTQVLDDYRIRVTTPQAIEGLPALFSHPSFRVGVVRQGTGWPLGSGPYRIDPLGIDPDDDVICEANEYFTGDVGSVDRLVFRIREDRDPRDLSAVGADLFLVRELGAVDYLRSLGYEAIPLHWDRNYLLLMPPAGQARNASWISPDYDRRDLARNVVTAEGRESFRIAFPAGEGIGDRSGARGDIPPARSAPPAGQGAIVCPEDDTDARFLAEKIAADLRHGRFGSAAKVYPAPRARRAFAESLRRGSEFAYVFPLARNYNDGGLLIRELAACAPWLMHALQRTPGSLPPSGVADCGEIADRLVRTGLVTPLVLTRAHLVHGAGLAGGKVDGLGLPDLGDVGRPEGSGVP